MPAAQTYEPIATTTLGSAASSITFSSIPATYTDLVLVLNPIVTTATTFGVRYNNVSTGSSYSITRLEGNGTTASSGRLAGQNELRISFVSTSRTTNVTSIVANIIDYSNTTTNKMTLSRAGAYSEGTEAIVGIFISTSAINRIDIIPMAGGTIINTGTMATIYGIKAA